MTGSLNIFHFVLRLIKHAKDVECSMCSFEQPLLNLFQTVNSLPLVSSNLIFNWIVYFHEKCREWNTFSDWNIIFIECI